VLQCVAISCIVSHCVEQCSSGLQCVTACCSVLQCVAVCCSVLQCAAMCHTVLQRFTINLVVWTHFKGLIFETVKYVFCGTFITELTCILFFASIFSLTFFEEPK